MAQQLLYNFKSNGWTQTMKLTVPMQKFCNTVSVTAEVIGVSKGIEGTIDMNTGKLSLSEPVKIKPYEETGKTKVLTEFKVEKFTLLQIKGYLN